LIQIFLRNFSWLIFLYYLRGIADGSIMAACWELQPRTHNKISSIE